MATLSEYINLTNDYWQDKISAINTRKLTTQELGNRKNFHKKSNAYNTKFNELHEKIFDLCECLNYMHPNSTHPDDLPEFELYHRSVSYLQNIEKCIFEIACLEHKDDTSIDKTGLRQKELQEKIYLPLLATVTNLTNINKQYLFNYKKEQAGNFPAHFEVNVDDLINDSMKFFGKSIRTGCKEVFEEFKSSWEDDSFIIGEEAIGKILTPCEHFLIIDDKFKLVNELNYQLLSLQTSIGHKLKKVSTVNYIHKTADLIINIENLLKHHGHYLSDTQLKQYAKVLYYYAMIASKKKLLTIDLVDLNYLQQGNNELLPFSEDEKRTSSIAAMLPTYDLTQELRLIADANEMEIADFTNTRTQQINNIYIIIATLLGITAGAVLANLVLPLAISFLSTLLPTSLVTAVTFTSFSAVGAVAGYSIFNALNKETNNEGVAINVMPNY